MPGYFEHLKEKHSGTGHMPHSAAEAYTRDTDTTPEELHHISQHPDLKTARMVLKNHNTAEHTIAAIHQRGSSDPEHGEKIKKDIGKHPNAPKALVHEAINNLPDKEYEHYYHHETLMNPKADPKVVSAKVDKILASNKRTAYSSDHDQLAKEWFNHESFDPKEIDKYVKHPNPKIAVEAALSRHSAQSHYDEIVKHPNLNHDTAKELVERDRENEDFEPSLTAEHIKALHDKKFKSESTYERNGLEKEILKHPNTPKEVLNKYIARKPSESTYYNSDSERTLALKHPNIEATKVEKLARENDPDAISAAVKREDSSEDLISHIHKGIEKTKDTSKWQYENKINEIAKHPNLPLETQKKMARGDAVNARSVLNRKDIDKDVLSEVIQNKNTKIAAEALKHPGITKEHIQEAFGRKAKEVSRAAAAHPLANQEMKLEKLSSDPKAVLDMASKQHKPEVYHEIFKHGKDSGDTLEALETNPNTPPEVLNKILDHASKNEIKKNRWGSYRPTYKMGEHPNLDKEGRVKLLTEFSHGTSHPNLQPDEMKAALEYHKAKGDGESQSYQADKFLRHPNLSPELAKEIVTGQHGYERSSYHGDDLSQTINDRPKVFTPEVVKAGLDVRPEFANQKIVSSLAQSKHLKAEELNKYLDAAVPTTEDEPSMNKHEAILKGVAKNPNLESSKLKELINETHALTRPGDTSGLDSEQKTQIQKNALDNPSLSDDHFKEIYRGNKLHNTFDSDIIEQAHERKLDGDLAETSNNPRLVEAAIHSRYGSGLDKEKLGSALKNKNSEVVSSILKKIGDFDSIKDRRGSGVLDNADKEKLIDHLADSPHEEVRQAALPLISNKKKEEIIAGTDINEKPDIIRTMDKDQVAKVKLDRKSSIGAVNEILQHPHVTKEQIGHALERSPGHIDGAIHAIKKSGALNESDKDELYNKAFKSHPTDSHVLQAAAFHSKDPNTLKSLIESPHKDENTIRGLLNNKSVKSGDLDSIINSPATEHHGKILEALASSDKASTKLLTHIAKMHPEHLEVIAYNKKAANKTIAKQIISKGSVAAKAALINNDKVDPALKEPLFKQPAVMMKARPEMVPVEALHEYAKGEDLKTAAAVISHLNANPKVIETAVNNLLSHANKGHEDNEHIESGLTEAAKTARNITPDTQEALSLHRPELAADVIKNSRNNFDGQLTEKVLEKYPKNPHILAAACNSKGVKDNPRLISQVIKQVDLNAPVDESQQVKRPWVIEINQLLSNSMATPENYAEAFDKLKEQRGVGFDYKEDAHGFRQHDASLLTKIAQNAPEQVQDQLIGHPELAEHLSENENLSKKNFDKLLDDTIDDTNKSGAFSNAPGIVNRFMNLSQNPSADSGHLSKIYSAISADNNIKDHVLGVLAKNKRISPELATKIFNEHPDCEQIVDNKNLPVGVLMENAVKAPEKDGRYPGNLWEPMAMHPQFRLKDFNQKLEGEQAYKDSASQASIQSKVYRTLPRNYNADPEDLKSVYEWTNKLTEDSSIHSSLLKNPRTSADIIEDMVKNSYVSKKDAFHSTAVGGKLFREEPVKFPEAIKGLKAGNEIAESSFRPSEGKVNDVISKIPEGGFIEWAQFKKEHPSLAGNPVIQKMFTSASKQRLTKESAEEYKKNYPGEKKFHSSYSAWTQNLQNHNGKPQLVVQINNGPEQDQMYQGDNTVNGVYQMIHDAQYSSNHPVNPQTVGWSRVDTSDPEHWFIEEIQSDLNSGIKGEIHKMKKGGGSHKMDSYGIEQDQVDSAVKKLETGLQGWDRAALNHVIELAKKQGVKKISIHSGQSKTRMNKGPAAEVTNKYQKLYNGLPEEYGFQQDIYRNVSSANEKSENYSKLKDLPVWTLNLEKKAIKKSLVNDRKDLIKSISMAKEILEKLDYAKSKAK